METYSEKLEQLKEKYIGTPIESFVLEEDMEEAPEEEIEDEDLEPLPYEEILMIEEPDEFVLQFGLFLSKKCDYGNSMKVLDFVEKVFYYVDTLNEEVHASGFDGYLSGGYFPGAAEIENSLAEINAKKVLKIWKKVEKKFPNQCIPKDLEERINIMEKKHLSFDRLEDKFYDYPDDLEQLLFEYVHKKLKTTNL